MKSINLIFLIFVFLQISCEKGNKYLTDVYVNHEEIELNNTVWVINQTNEIPGKNTTKGLIPTLHFKDGVMSVGTNSNIAFSDYKLKGNKIEFDGLTTTYKYCNDMKIESYFGIKINSISL